MFIQLHPSRRASATNLPTAAVLGAVAGIDKLVFSSMIAHSCFYYAETWT
jgi:hypothetical protein